MGVGKRYPTAVNPKRVGTYPSRTYAGGGLVWDEVLEYRVWCSPERGAEDVGDGSDYFQAFATYPKALAFSRRTRGADEPLALVLQRQYIDEPEAGKYVHVKKARVTEWPVEFLRRPRRDRDTIPQFLSPNAPANRLDILRGLARRKQPRRSGGSRAMGRGSRVKNKPTKKAKPKPAKKKVKAAMGINRIVVTDGKINPK